jgi:prolyl oligopeptidase
LVGGNFFAIYLKDAFSLVRQFSQDGTLIRTVGLPGIGSASGFGGKSDTTESFYSYSSFNAPPTIYRYDIAAGESTVFRAAEVDFDPADYVVKQVFYESKDGTRVPMFIAHRSDLEIKGDTPTLLYGYGGFNIALSPSFSVTRLGWMEMGGIFALANIRGGGEYGEDWHHGGMKLNKQNVFDDFIAAGEYLVAEGYTKPAKLSVMGGSNGGLLVGAVVNQRPDLFGAALPAVGVMDMLRFHHFTAGRFWVGDYGSADNPEEFKALLAYSPYHNLKDGTDYPAIMVTTADTDDRVVPGHSFKYAARLQEAQAGDAPVLIRIETRAGHGSGKPTAKIIEEYSDAWGFLVENLDVTLPEGYGQPEE